MTTPTLPDVRHVNVNHPASLRDAVSRHSREIFQRKRVWFLSLSLMTGGIFWCRLRKRALREIHQAIAARKLLFFNDLSDRIEAMRTKIVRIDPRQAVNAIFMEVQAERVGRGEDLIEFKAIYTPVELLLFITNPAQGKKEVKLYRLKSRSYHLDYIRTWHGSKKRAKVNQFRQIQNINFYYKVLRKEFSLNSHEIQDRLTRTTLYRKDPTLLTQFKNLSRAFQEIVIAYQDFEELQESHPRLFCLLKVLSTTSQSDIQMLQAYLDSHTLPKDLPLENRRQLIQLGNQQEVLYTINQEEQLGSFSLILNQYQWQFLLSTQEVSRFTLGLLDWALANVSEEMKPSPSFLDHIMTGMYTKVTDHPDTSPLLYQKIEEDPNLSEMTVDFALELYRDWPPFHLYRGEQILFYSEAQESLSVERLILIYKELEGFAQEDRMLFCILQQAVSQEGKNGFHEAIEKGVNKLLGEKPEYFLPILTNADITIVREEQESMVNIHYIFEQVIMKHGQKQESVACDRRLVIVQPLIKSRDHWFSLEPTIKTTSATAPS